MQLLKKITISKCEITKDDCLKSAIAGDGAVVPMLRVFGRATSVEEKLSDYGPYCLFKGAFEAVNLKTGESFRSGLLIIQGPAEGMLQGAVSFIGQEGGEVPFGYEIGVKYVKNEQGNPYQFTARDLLENSSIAMTDPLAELRSVALGGSVKPAVLVSSKKKEAVTA